jgi:hypothetical protein
VNVALGIIAAVDDLFGDGRKLDPVFGAGFGIALARIRTDLEIFFHDPECLRWFCLKRCI